MSYILDALRRADAERGRGGVPSIHTQQQFTPLEADDDGERARPRRIGWLAGALALALAAVVAWIALKPEPPPAVAVVPRAVVPMSPVPGPVPSPVPNAAAPATATHSGATSSDGAMQSDARSPAQAPNGAERHARAARPSKLPDVDTEPAPGTTTRDRAAAAPHAEHPASSSAGDRVYAVRDLPDDVRRALPTITVNGSTWSADSASRMLMIGGQIFHEGDSVAPGVALERIKPHAAVLAFRGYRYELTF